MICRLAWRNLWRNRLRSGIILAAMVFGMLGVLLMVGFITAMIESMIDNAIRYQTAHLQVHNSDFLLNEELAAWLPDADRMAVEIARLPGVAGVTVRQVVDGMLGSAAGSRGVRINGIVPAEERKVTAVIDTLTAGEIWGETGRNPILVSQRTAAKLNLRLGSKVVLTFSGLGGEVTGAAFRVRGLFATPATSFDQANVFVRRSDLARFSGLLQAHELAIRLQNTTLVPQLRRQVSEIVGRRGLVRDWQQVQPVLAAVMGSLGISNAIMMGIFVVALGFGIVNIMLMSVFERTREFGVLMAIGMTRGRVLSLILLEAFLLGACGSLVGLIVSGLLIRVTGEIGLPFGAMAEGLGAYGVDTVLYPRVSFSYYLLLLGMVLTTSLVAALYPARQILKKRPSQALQEKH